MKQEVTATGKTVDAALAVGADMLGVDVSKVTYEIIENPKKGFFGIGEVPAKLKVFYETTPEETAFAFIKTVLSDMDLSAEAELSATNEQKREFLITITGEDASQLIGHHGDTLDSLQYLANLAANKREEDGSRNYTRITVDIKGYREKRAETLRELARRMASKVLKYKKSITLEPMNSYERRIIHAEIQNIEGVSTNSIGSDDSRRVVIFLEGSRAQEGKPRRGAKPSGKKAQPAEAEETERTEE